MKVLIEYFDRVYEKNARRITNFSSRKFILIVIATQILLHLPVLHFSPVGKHTWRQVMGQATARNYFEEDNRFFYPRQDVRKEAGDLGISYFEFPLPYYLMAQSYKITGFHHANGRIMMLFMGILLLIAVYRLAKVTGLSETSARWFLFFVSFSPYFFYYSVTIIPNLPALAWFTLGLSIIIPEISFERWRWKFWAGVMFLTVGTLSKSSFLFFGLPVCYLFSTQFLRSGNKKILLAALGAAFVVLSLNGLQYFHAHSLFEQAPLERQIYTELAPHPFPTELGTVLKILRPAFSTWFLEFFVNSAAIPLFAAGLFAGILNRRWKNWDGGFWLLWVGSFLIFSLFFFEQLRQHSYYQTPMLLISALVSAYGVQFLLKKKFTRRIAVLCICIMPFSMVGRVFHRWTTHKEVPVELLTQSKEFETIIPKGDRVIVIDDRSPVIALYYLHRKGVVIPTGTAREKIAELKPLGFKWVVSKGPLKNFPGVKESTLSTNRIGEFNISRI